MSTMMGPPSVRGNTPAATSTFSMSYGLASTLHERGLGLNAHGPGNQNKKLGLEGPQTQLYGQATGNSRFRSIVTETLSDSRHSQTERIYSIVNLAPPLIEGISNTGHPLLIPDPHRPIPKSTQETPTNIPPQPRLVSGEVPPLEGISDTAHPMLVPDINILDKLKNEGLENAGSTSAAQVVLDTGLNSILSVGRRSGLLTRHTTTTATASINTTEFKTIIATISSATRTSGHSRPSQLQLISSFSQGLSPKCSLPSLASLKHTSGKLTDQVNAKGSSRVSDCVVSATTVDVASISQPLLRHLSGLHMGGGGGGLVGALSPGVQLTGLHRP